MCNLVVVNLHTDHIDAQKNKQHSFNLNDLSLRGGEMQISNPCKWTEIESEYLAVGLNLSQNCPSREGGNP